MNFLHVVSNSHKCSHALLPLKVAVRGVQHTPCSTLLSTDLVHRLTFFSSIKYCIGGIEYSANDIEHGILRATNPVLPLLRSSLVARSGLGGYFKQNDPRMQQVRRSLVLCACCMVCLHRVLRIGQGVPSLHGQQILSVRLGLSSIQQVRPPCTSCLHPQKAHAQSVWGHALQQVSTASADRTGLAQSPAQLVGCAERLGFQHDKATSSAIAAVSGLQSPASLWPRACFSHFSCHCSHCCCGPCRL